MITRGRSAKSSDREPEAVGGRILIEISVARCRRQDDAASSALLAGSSGSAPASPRRQRYVLPSLRRLAAFLPFWILHHRRDRWLNRREMRSIARLETWSRALQAEPAPPPGAVAIFDHGPLYRLARLQEFGPALAQSDPFQRWWNGSWQRWFAALDVVVVLEAPDAVLLQRIDERGHWFLGADHPREEKQEFLARYRLALSRILQGSGHVPTILRFRGRDLRRQDRRRGANRDLDDAIDGRSQEALRPMNRVLKRAVKAVSNTHRPDGRPNVFLFSTPRSGSTWLMELIWSQPGFKYCNQPLSLFNPLVRKHLGIDIGSALRARFCAHVRAVLPGHLRRTPQVLEPNPLRGHYRPVTHRIVFEGSMDARTGSTGSETRSMRGSHSWCVTP